MCFDVPSQPRSVGAQQSPGFRRTFFVQFHFKNGRKHFSPLLRDGERAELAIGLELHCSTQETLVTLGEVIFPDDSRSLVEKRGLEWPPGWLHHHRAPHARCTATLGGEERSFPSAG